MAPGVVPLSPDGHTRHSRSAARSLPEPAPAYRTAGVEAQWPSGGIPEVVPVAPPALRGPDPGMGSPEAGSWLRLGLAACRAGLPVAASAAGGQRCLASEAGLCRTAGEAHLTVSGSAVIPPDEGSRAAAPGRAVFWILAGRYRLCLTTSC
jgi:hypothetical protein